MSPEEVIKAVVAGNTIFPAGNVRIKDLNRLAPVNSVVARIQELGDLPIRAGAGPTVFLRDIGTVEDSSDILTGYALVNGRRTVYIPVTKRVDTSTLEVVNRVKAALPRMQERIREDMKISFEFDQSTYVKNALRGLVTEGALGALLTGTMVFLFLRDVRSALIVVVTIPFALLAALVGLWLTGQTVNIMTLGGLALAIGILVDEATVAIENIHTHLARGESRAHAVLEAARETAVPRLLAMLSILAVFVPSFFMSGVTGALFVPLSLAVGFAMLASYSLSSTLVPVLSAWLLREREEGDHGQSFFQRTQATYKQLAERLLRVRWPLMACYAVVAGTGILLVGPCLGTDISPPSTPASFSCGCVPRQEHASSALRSLRCRRLRLFARRPVQRMLPSRLGSSVRSRRVIQSTRSISGRAGRTKPSCSSPCSQTRTFGSTTSKSGYGTNCPPSSLKAPHSRLKPAML